MRSAEFHRQRAEMARQLRRRGIHNPRVLDAMARIPRERFVPAKLQSAAYADRALPIACGQTISQPYMVALMTEALELTGEETVLEIGTGSGYQTAVLAELTRAVITVERHPVLSQSAAQLLSELGYGNIVLQIADGTQGSPSSAPYARMLVTAAAANCPPALLSQLADPGLLVAPLGPATEQQLQQIHKAQGQLRTVNLTPCRFVPLISSTPHKESTQPMGWVPKPNPQTGVDRKWK